MSESFNPAENWKDLFVILGVLLLIGAAGFGIYSYNSTDKYAECVQACEDNRECLRSEINYSDNRRPTNCVEYSDVSCKNICVEKYK